jgi:hypothetical protein
MVALIQFGLKRPPWGRTWRCSRTASQYVEPSRRSGTGRSPNALGQIANIGHDPERDPTLPDGAVVHDFGAGSACRRARRRRDSVGLSSPIAIRNFEVASLELLRSRRAGPR